MIAEDAEDAKVTEGKAMKSEWSRAIIGCAMRVHTALGPGLLERAYEECLAMELELSGYGIERQVRTPLYYRGQQLNLTYRIDIVVEQSLVVEVKAVSAITDLHKAQLLSYLRMSGYPLGLLLNFHVTHLRDGITRIANGWNEQNEQRVTPVQDPSLPPP